MCQVDSHVRQILFGRRRAVQKSGFHFRFGSRIDDFAAALDNHIAYFGSWSIDEAAQTVTHHRLGSVQPGDTADLVRKFKIEGDRLTLNTVGTNYFVYWERMK